MPTIVRDLFDAATVPLEGAVRWLEPPPLHKPGVYVVSLSADPEDLDAALPTAPLDHAKLDFLLAQRPELRLDGERPDVEQLAARLAACWLPDEPVLYIGMTDATVRKRVTAYYRTKLGARSPHSGGWPLQTLANLDTLWVHYGPVVEAEEAEKRMLAKFMAGVSTTARDGLHDRTHAIPFANLTGPDGRKAHGITGAREPRQRASGKARTGATLDVANPALAVAARASDLAASTPATRPSPGQLTQAAEAPRSLHILTQPITPSDLAGGRVRIGISSGGKKLLSVVKSRVTVVLRGRQLDEVRWDPKMGPDRERSGVLGVGRVPLAELVQPGEQLALRCPESGLVSLD